jgi:hypothetical protein
MNTIYNLCDKIEDYAIHGIQYSGTALVVAVGLVAVNVLEGAFVSFLTDGRYTTLDAAIITSPKFIYAFSIFSKISIISFLACTIITIVATTLKTIINVYNNNERFLDLTNFKRAPGM